MSTDVTINRTHVAALLERERALYLERNPKSNNKYDSKISNWAMKRKYWSDDLDQRRRKLFPFIWNTISENGQLYGNRLYQNKIDNANPY